MQSSTNTKIIISGSNIESYIFEHSFLYGPRSGFSHPEDSLKKPKVRNLVSLKKHIIRRKKYLTCLINTNAYSWARTKNLSLKFVTLTFEGNFSNPRECNKYYSLFIKRLNYRWFPGQERSLKYVTVLEFQGRGTIHYHTIFFNLPYIPQKELASLWGKGFVYIQRITRIKDLGHYVTKDMVKDFADPRLYKQKRYFRSDSLYEPQVFYNKELCTSLSSLIPADSKVFKRQFETAYLGTCEYSHYILKKDYSYNEFLNYCLKFLSKQKVKKKVPDLILRPLLNFSLT